MKRYFLQIFACIFAFGLLFSCGETEVTEPVTSDVTPINVDEEGFDLLEKMQGHWIGYNQVLSWEWEWFGFDYRPISPSHIFGIFEGGTMGNLFTSFFVADFKGTKTIMARNGGVLSGIYRTSYFVLDSVHSENGEAYFRLVDAQGGAALMYMELNFVGDSLNFNAYTSRLGENMMPTRHMTFKGSKQHLSLSETAAEAVGFPQNVSAWDFSDGFRQDYLYVLPNETQPKTASFLSQMDNNDVFALATDSGDPFTITDHPYLGYLQVDIERNAEIANDGIFLYLSDVSLTDENGYMQVQAFNNLLLFPDLTANDDSFLFTYLHPTTYYVTVIADHNGNGYPDEGDITHVSQQIEVTPEGKHQIYITNINVQN